MRVLTKFLAVAQPLSCLALLAAGCGAPGEPVPPSPPIPVAVADLAAHQDGDGVQLVFTLPAKTVMGDALASPPAVEILRGLAKPDGSTVAKSLRIVSTIPGSLIASYISEGRVKLTDPIAPADVQANPGGAFTYVVRTRASRKRASSDSNAVSVRLFPVPERISSLQATVAESAITLTWTAPTQTSAGAPLGSLSGYRIYRGELDPSSIAAASKDISQARWKMPVALLASPEETSYRDTLFDFGKTYAYIARTVVPADGGLLESSDSSPAIVTPLDTFPPAAPQNLAAAVLPGSTSGALLVDLSWSINLETDLAGYRVYRSEQPDSKGQLVTIGLLPAPAYRDTSVVPGRRYWYSVTAVDRAGNESTPSAAVVVDVAKPPS
ncbi:MAG TPA: hypothetical protein VJN42_07605 [Candidatus Acidoferrum sp.]|nr:hypothetical protein [Candidatus Acidoferrum sp.]